MAPGGSAREAMELLRFALGAPPLDSRHRIACRCQQEAPVGAAGLDLSSRSVTVASLGWAA
jgi:hypothetical protein